MIEFFRLRARSFRYAFAGWWYVIRTQKNAWIHAMISIAVIIVALWLRLVPRLGRAGANHRHGVDSRVSQHSA